MIEAIIQRGFQRWRSSIDPLQPREDIEDLQYTRARYLGTEALRAFIYNTRNVKIKGTMQVKYKSYTLTYIGQQISRRTLENRSIRLFQHVLQNIFDFPTSFDGINQLLVIKDKYSGKLFLFLLIQKSYIKVFNTIYRFEYQVRQQYRLSIYKIYYNND